MWLLVCCCVLSVVRCCSSLYAVRRWFVVAVHCVLFVVCCSFCVVCCTVLSVVVYSSRCRVLCVVCGCLLFGVCFIVRRLWFAVGRCYLLLFVVYWLLSLFVVRCSLFVACVLSLLVCCCCLK